MIMILKFILKIIGIGPIKTKNDLTTLIGALVGLICYILNQHFGINIPPEMNLTIIGILIALILRFWKPTEKPNIIKKFK